jgi:hypothetical protein
MGKLIFSAKDVRRVVEHSLAAPEQGQMVIGIKRGELQYGLPEAPSVLLVHDDGVYLMSNGKPRDLVSGDDGKGGGRSFCAYAKGCDPSRDAECWDTSRMLVGGDDFGETLPWAEQIKAKLDAGAKQIVISVTADNIELE